MSVPPQLFNDFVNQLWLFIMVADGDAFVQQLFNCRDFLLVAINRQQGVARLNLVTKLMVKLNPHTVVQLVISLLATTAERHASRSDFIG